MLVACVIVFENFDFSLISNVHLFQTMHHMGEPDKNNANSELLHVMNDSANLEEEFSDDDEVVI